MIQENLDGLDLDLVYISFLMANAEHTANTKEVDREKPERASLNRYYVTGVQPCRFSAHTHTHRAHLWSLRQALDDVSY